MIKKFTMIACLTACTLTSTTFAQEQKKFKVGIDLGTAIGRDGIGGTIAIEPRYRINNNMSVGIKLGLGVLTQKFRINSEFIDPLHSKDLDVNVNRSYMGTFNYHFNTNRKFSPYLGGGLGYFQLDGSENRVIEEGNNYTSKSYSAREFGTMLRGGFERGKFRMGVEYYIVPKTDLTLNGVQMKGTTNTFFNIHVGYSIGGGRK